MQCIKIVYYYYYYYYYCCCYYYYYYYYYYVDGQSTYVVTEFFDNIHCAQEDNKNDNTISNITRSNKNIEGRI